MARYVLSLVVCITLTAYVVLQRVERHPKEDPVLRTLDDGVEVVLVREDAWSAVPSYSVGDPPVLSVGGDPDIGFSSITDAQFLPDGRVMVADGGAQRIWILGNDGSPLREIGSQGDGPGGFQWIESIHVLSGDRVAAHDPRLKRLSIFGPDGSLLNSVPVSDPSGRSAASIAVLADETLLLLRAGPDPANPSSGLLTNAAAYLHMDSRGALLDTLAMAPGDELLLLTSTGDGGPGFRLPLFGLTAALGMGDTLFFTRSGRGREVGVRRLSDGRLLRQITWDGPPLHVTRQAVDSALADHGGNAAALDVYLQQVPLPDTRPGWGQLHVADAGALWVSEYAQAGKAPGRWRVFSKDGGPVGLVDLPPDTHLLDVAEDRILVKTGPADRPRLEVLALVPVAGPTR